VCCCSVSAQPSSSGSCSSTINTFKEEDRNILLFVLTDPAARPLFGAEWAAIARRMVTQFRAAHDLWAGDPAFAELVARLCCESREFARWWSTHDVGETRAGQKVLHRAEGAAPCGPGLSFRSCELPVERRPRAAPGDLHAVWRCRMMKEIVGRVRAARVRAGR
jgi:hypothetical protein